MAVFVNRYRELRSGWAIAAAVAVMVVSWLAARSVAGWGDEADPVFKLVVTLAYGLVCVGGLLGLFKALYRRSWRQLGLIPERAGVRLAQGLLFGAVCIAAVFGLLIAVGEARVVSVDPGRLVSAALAVEFVSVGVFMFSEELLARGFFMTAMKTTRRTTLIVLVPPLLFALLHFMNPGVTPLSFANVWLAGVLFACLFLKSGSLWAPTGFHIAWNFLWGDVLGFNVGLDTDPATRLSVVETAVGTRVLLTGGANGPEAGLFTTLVLAAALAWTMWRVKPPVGDVWTCDSDLPLDRVRPSIGGP
jgi:membrane protease YdiL (CAAX protease family)